MYIAEKLRKENLAEYLIYMWQVEDLLRSFHLDLDKLSDNYLSRFKGLNEEQCQRQREWYGELIDMMRSEGITEKGHLQICKNVILTMEELHASLMNSSKFPYYHTAYFNVLPIIVELRKKQGSDTKGELETCFEFLYGVMLLRLQKKTVSEETSQALNTVSTFVGMLSDYCMKDKESPIEF